LKCCLNYELDTYLDALQHFPDNADVIQITKSPAYLVKKDIFKNLMWYTLPDSSKHYPLTITRVKEIQRLNSIGQKPDNLEPVEVISSKPKEIEPEYVDLVGQISLKTLEKNDRRRNDKNARDNREGDRRGGGNRNKPAQQGQRNPNQPQQGSGERNRPQQRNPNQGDAPKNVQGQPPRGDRSQGPRPPQNRGPQRPNQNRPPQPPRNNPPAEPK
jgi:hypothetical protein